MSSFDFQNLEKNKKKYSMLFLLFSFLGLLPVIIFISNDFIKVIIGIVLAIHLIIAVSYCIKGLAIAAMCITYYLIYAAGIIFGIIINSVLSLPGFINRDILYSLAVIPVIIFTNVIPLPVYAKEYIQDKLGGITIKKTKAEELYFDTEYEKLVTYDTLMEYKSGISYSSKSYSLANCSDFLRRLRIIIGSVFVGAGFITVIAALYMEDDAVSFIHSWVFWTIIGSITLIIMGFTILLLGFLRSLLTPVFCGFTFALIYYIYEFLKLSYQKSIPMFCLITALTITSLVMGIYLICKKLYSKNYHTLAYFEDEDGFKGIDLSIDNAIPVAEYDTVFQIEIQAGKEITLKDIENFNYELVYFTGRRKLVLAGVIFNYISCKYKLIIYFSNENKTKEILSGFLNRRISYPYTMNIVKDKEWNIYKSLYPDEYTLIQYYNKSIVEELEANQFDFTQDYPIVFNLLFESSNDAIKCKDAAEENGFEKAVYTDNSETAEENKLLKKYYHIVTLKITSKVGLESININCRKVMDFASQFNGELYEWLFEDLLDENIDDTK